MESAKAQPERAGLALGGFRELGRAVSAEELCAHCPELLDDLKGRIAELQAMSRLLGDETNPATATTAPSRPRRRAGRPLPRRGAGRRLPGRLTSRSWASWDTAAWGWSIGPTTATGARSSR